MIKKIYLTKEGPAVYINNVKTIISETAEKVLNFDNDPFDGSINPSVLGSVVSVTKSVNEFTEPKDEDIIATAEKCRIESFNVDAKGFNFSGWFMFMGGFCVGLRLKRNDREMRMPGTPEEAYQKIKSQLSL